MQNLHYLQKGLENHTTFDFYFTAICCFCILEKNTEACNFIIKKL